MMLQTGMPVRAGTHGKWVVKHDGASRRNSFEPRAAVGPGLRRDDGWRWSARILGVAFIVVVAFTESAPARAHPPTIVDGGAEKGTAEEIVDFRKRLADAVKAKDAARLREMYANTFQHTHTSAKSDTKDARIVALLAGDAVIETAPVDDLVIRAHAGGWVAIAYGTSPIVALADGKTYVVKWMAVYVRTEQSWQLAGSHATRAGEVQK
jgi:Domain of unknown function (DUF4440)